MSWQEQYRRKLVSLEEASGVIRSNDRVYYTSCGNAPADLINEICKRKDDLRNVIMFSSLVLYPFEYFKPEYNGHIQHQTLFMGPIERRYHGLGNVHVLLNQFGQMTWIMEHGVKPDVFLTEVPPPDEDGNFSLSIMGATVGAAVSKLAKTVIVQVNRQAPFVYGPEEAFVNIKDVDYICEKDHPLPTIPESPVSDIDRKIAANILPFIKDGSAIQIGIGSLGNAIGYSLEHHKELGVHTEMFVDSMIALVEKGVITGSKKTLHPGEISVSFGIGTQKLYDFMHKNDSLRAYPITYIADESVIARNKNFVSINNALMCDLTGQVCSEGVGHWQYSGTGGQLNFVRGAWKSEGGQSFLTLESTYKPSDGQKEAGSRIQCTLPPGAVVTVPRTDVQFIATEQGIADLRGKTISDRVKAIVNIAHPDYREQLMKEAKEAQLV
jgi:4-hydroxybutyrate CoA-transferase